MKTVRILGTAPNLANMSRPPLGVEIWACNQKRGYASGLPWVIDESVWTRWFNLHTRYHQNVRYMRTVRWYREQSKPIYMQDVQPDIPASRKFPKDELLTFFGHRYFTCQAAWMIALAIWEGFKRIELWGFEISSKKEGGYAWERPCVFYWIDEAKRRGVEVIIPPELIRDTPPGDPLTYTGWLYGYEPHNEYYRTTYRSALEVFMREKVQVEIDALVKKIDGLKQDLILADGALQAFKYVLAQLDAPEAHVNVHEVPSGD